MPVWLYCISGLDHPCKPIPGLDHTDRWLPGLDHPCKALPGLDHTDWCLPEYVDTQCSALARSLGKGDRAPGEAYNHRSSVIETRCIAKRRSSAARSDRAAPEVRGRISLEEGTNLHTTLNKSRDEKLFTPPSLS